MDSSTAIVRISLLEKSCNLFPKFQRLNLVYSEWAKPAIKIDSKKIFKDEMKNYAKDFSSS